MEGFGIIQRKLEEFLRKYYLNELVKGVILFISIGLLYTITLLVLENYLWLNSVARSIMFWSFIAVQSFLIKKYLFIPLFKLFKISKGIGYVQASRIIGNHFPNVNDKLLNVLQLKENSEQSELLLASIDQKINALENVPFHSAVNFKGNIKYLKLAVIPVFIVILVYVSGNIEVFSNSYKRVVNYEIAYEPPAPFNFILQNSNLQVREGEDFLLTVNTVGNVIPDEGIINYNGEAYYLKSVSPGKFQYNFQHVTETIKFNFEANGISSKSYEIDVLNVPKLTNFKVGLEYPAYTGIKNKTVEGTGNLNVPEGTRINWLIEAEATKKITLKEQDGIHFFKNEKNNFTYSTSAFRSFSYQISTSNNEVKNYENLEYSVKVFKDQFPQIAVEIKKDTIDGQTLYFKGKVNDDYGISALKLFYHQKNNIKNLKFIPIEVGFSAIGEFLAAFPGKLALEEGKSYELYFQVFDNDAINGSKGVKSEIFHFRKMDQQELEDRKLENQKESISGMDRSFEKLKDFQEDFNELNKLQKENKKLDFNGKEKLRKFLERQRQQEEILKRQQDKLKNNFSEKENDFEKELKRRLDNNEKKLQENEELRKELEKYADKISKEELGEKLEKMSKSNKLQEKNMEQLLELTKRYYVQEKQKKIYNDLERLAEKQKELSKKTVDENTKEDQEKLINDFKEITKGIEELQKENAGLKKPMDILRDEKAEEQISEEQKKAIENISKSEQNKAKEHQEKAAKKMKQMMKKMKNKMQNVSGEAMMEDADMLRQILDNLIRFSFEQENLLEVFKRLNAKSPDFSKNLREQNTLKAHFKHVDDSIYSLALRNPMITEKVLEKLTEIEYNIDKSLARLAENQIEQGIGSQQYVVTGANDLAVLLSDVLSNMQMAGSGSGGGKSGGKGFQLPDIIQKQGDLGEQMEKGVQKGQKGKSGDGKEGKDGEQNNKGQENNGKNNGDASGEGKGKSGGNGLGNEELSGEVFEIFQQQQLLKQQLKDQLEKNGFTRDELNLLREMDDLENSLLENGFSEENAKRMQNIKHKLLELERASFKQGQDKKRTANTNKESYENTAAEPILKAKEYFNTNEILIRQILPLREVYKIKVKDYFNVGNN